MNVYDFDKTIYHRDATVDFYRYCVRKKPSILLCLPVQLIGVLGYVLTRHDKTRLKERFFVFLKKIPDFDAYIHSFWEEHRDGIRDWYIANQQPDDVVNSASPRFILQPICEQLGITHLIASEVDQITGMFASPNNRGKEKVKRFYAEFPGAQINNFYSDSFADQPLADIAKQSFFVRRGIVEPWPANRK